MGREKGGELSSPGDTAEQADNDQTEEQNSRRAQVREQDSSSVRAIKKK